ncbi:MAG: MerR family transcriptional regulator [Gemmatimonadetes bacterium]|nr:MerR family transcriptional regulator [Gemmatimonadota bacterium]
MKTDAREWRVGEVAGLAHVTVRTIHHYHEIGLLVPSGRSDAGYRRYSETDLRRLQQILLFRELGFTLEAIQQMVDDPAFDRKQALEAQRGMMIEQKARTEAILRGVDRALAEMKGEATMSADEMFHGFEDFNKQYEAEVEERWGKSDAYKESMRRTKGYSKEDWKRFKAEGEAATQRWIELKAAGASPTSEPAMDQAEGARLQIDRWFYPCLPAMHVKLAEMYEADPRFTATYEKMAPGMSSYVAAAIRANADRQERKAKK